MVRPASRWAPRPPLGVAGFPWHQWQLCSGISGNFRVEQVAALAWNRWQASPGIGGSFRVEYAICHGSSPQAWGTSLSAVGREGVTPDFDTNKYI